MSHRVSRRSILKATGVGGLGLGCAGLAGGAALAYRSGRLSAPELGRLPRVGAHVRPTDRAALGRDGVLTIAAADAPAARVIEHALAPGAGLEHLGLDIRQYAAEFICDPRRPNWLLDGVTRVSYEIIEVAWRAGADWPVNRNRAPHTDHVIGMRYAGVPRHQIVLLDDRAVYVGNTGHVGVIDDIQGPLRIDVNSDCHEEHQGFYKVLITGIA